MPYLSAMCRLLMFDTGPMHTLTIRQRQYVCVMNVALLGLFYGVSAAFLTHLFLLGQGGSAPGTASLLKITVAGQPVAFLMHAGAALFVWVFLKAAGGKADFITAYFDMGVAAISLWPLAPVAAALQAGMTVPWLPVFGSFLALYGAAVNVAVLKNTFCLSSARMAVAASVTAIYIGCFLYLWI